MALGTERLYSEFTSDQGVTYRISIYDDTSLGGNNSFRLGGDGFTLTYKGEGEERYHPIKSSVIQFTMYIEGDSATPTGSFLDLVQTADQDRFKVKIQRSTDAGVTYSNYWHGVIAPDISDVEDTNYPFPFRIKAVDGLSLMKNVDFDRDVYNGVNGQLTTNYTIANVICNFLEYYTGNIIDFFLTTETFLRESVHWYENTMPTITSNSSPLEWSAIYPMAFMKNTYNENEIKKSIPLSAYDALEAILKAWGLRIWQQQGYFHITHADHWRNSDSIWYYRRWSYTGTKLGSGTLTTSQCEQDLGNSTSGEPLLKLANNTESYYPPLKLTKAIYSNWANDGLYSETLALSDFVSAANMESNLIELGYLDNSGDAYLKINQRFGFTLLSTISPNDYSDYDGVTITYMIKIGSYYWKGFPDNEWTTTQSYTTLNLYNFLGNLYATLYHNIQFNTAALPTSDIAYFYVNKLTTNPYTSTGASYYNYDVFIAAHTNTYPSLIQYIQDDQVVTNRTFVSSDVNSTANEINDLGEMFIGDGPTTSNPSWGRIKVYNGTSYQNTVEEDWQAWETGTQDRITQILVEQNYVGQRNYTSLRKYKFRLDSALNDFGPLTSIKDTTNGNEIMVMNGYKFIANTDTIEGEYYKTDIDTTGLTNTLEEFEDGGTGLLTTDSGM